MIDPELHDWWSHHQLTELRYGDSLVSGAGVPLKVILPAFLGLDLRWFSRLFGRYDDNVVLLGFGESAAESFERVQYEGETPVQTLHAATLDREYRLTDSICSDLGISFDGNGYSIRREDRVAYQIYIHDDCFFFIEPADLSVVRRVLGHVLAQHAFYLKEGIKWGKAADDLAITLTKTGGFRLHSDRQGHCLRVWPLLDYRGSLGKSFRSFSIYIEDGEARFPRQGTSDSES